MGAQETQTTAADSLRGADGLSEKPFEKKTLISPAAKKLARIKNIDYAQITGSGPKGRIVKKDVAEFIVSMEAGEKKLPPEVRGKEMPVEAPGTVPHKKEKPDQMWKLGNEYPMSNMRKVIARRMSESASTAPHIYFFLEVDMTKILALREEIVARYERDLGLRISINDILIKLTALSIRDYPLLNARIENDRIVIPSDINVCLAVALPDGLIVPCMRNTDRKSLEEIVCLREDLVSRGRSGKLQLHELESGTFTISSLAMLDIFYFTAVLNPPQSGILTVGKTYERPVVVDREITIRPIAIFGLSVDHRIVDGAVAAAFLESLKEKLENPYCYLIN